MNPFILSAGAALCGAAVLAAAEPDEGLLFYAPFDGGAAAAHARGDGTPTAAIPPEFQPGVRGQALVIGGAPEDRERIEKDFPAHSNAAGRNVYYASTNNLDVCQGTVSFWLQPLDWHGTDGGFNVLFRTQAGRNHVMCYKYFEGQKLLVLIGKDERWTSVQHRIGHWKPGQWRHVAATWSPVEMRLFIDGHLVNVRKVRFPLEDAEPVDPLSVGPGGTWRHGFIGRSLVDELRIHDRPLGYDEIIALYRRDADAALLDAGHVTVGRRTPRLDGSLDAFEYPFEATGFSDLRGYVARRQSRYALSYDAEWLYVAVRSEAGDRLAAPGETDPPVSTNQAPMTGDGGNREMGYSNVPDRVELFLSPAPGREPLRHLVFTPDGTVRAGAHETAGSLAEAVRVAPSGTDGSWTLEAAIPFAALGFDGPPEGQTWRFNVARVVGAHEVSSAAPVAGSVADRAKFLEWRFRADAPDIRIAALFDPAEALLLPDVESRARDPGARLDWITISDALKEDNYGLRSTRAPLFAGGRAAPHGPRTVNPEHRLRDRMFFEFRIEESAEASEATQALYRTRFLFADRSRPMVTRFLHTLERRTLSVSAERRVDGDIQVRFLKSDGTEAWRARQAIPGDVTYFDALFDPDFSLLPPDTYSVRIDHVAADGTETPTWEQAYLVPGPDHPFLHPYVDPEADRVPAPWTPVTVHGPARQPSGFRVSTWGRSYGFGKGILFDSLISQGEEILAGPAVLRLDGGTLDPVSPVEMERGEATDMRAAFTRRADLGAFRAESRLVTHFDGYCEIALTLVPGDHPSPVTTLSLDIPLRGEAALLVRDGKIHNKNTGAKSGAVGDYWHQELVGDPFLWVGNDRVGFNWIAPSLEGWHCRRHARNVEILRTGDVALLRFNLADTPFRLDAPRTIRFGFTLTPTRPLDRAVLRRREHRDYQMWCQPWAFFGVPEYDTANVTAIRDALRNPSISPHANEVFLYMSDWFISPFYPAWSFFEQEWAMLAPGRAAGDRTGNWTYPDTALMNRNTYTRGCTHSQGWRNYLHHTRQAFFERQRIKPLTPEAHSYYFDTGIGATRCGNPRHGCSLWTGLDGQPRGRVFIDEERELWLNAYRMIRRTGPDARIYVHFGWKRAMPLQTFADIICTGEGPEGDVVADGGYYQLFTPEMFRATFSPYIWGIKMVLIDQNLRALSLSAPDAYLAFSLENPAQRRQVLHAFGYCVVHDVDTSSGDRKTLPLRQTLWETQDALGWDEEVLFHPYWENDAVRRLGDDIGRIMASAYSRKGKLLLAVLNDTDAERRIDLDLDLDRLGVAPGGEGHDVWDPERRYVLNARWSDTVPPRGFRLVLWP